MAWLERFWFGCGHCPGPQRCPLADAGETGQNGTPREGLGGGRLVLPAVAVFILPLLAAIGGAYLAGHWWANESFASLGRWQTAGALAGLVVGIGFARVLTGLIHPRGTRRDGGV